MDEGIRGRPVPSVFQAHFGFEFVEESFDDKPVSQQELVQDRHQIILHVSANARDQLQPLFPEISEEFYRPAEVELLLGDPTDAKKHLGWEPQISFDKLVERMVHCDLALLNHGV